MRIGEQQSSGLKTSPSDFRAGGNVRSPTLSTEEWEVRLGTQFRSARIAEGLDQIGLADATGLSVGAIRGLERGTGTTLRTIVRVARALGREDWLSSLAPPVTVSPIDRVRSGRRERTRVYRARAES